MTRSFRTDDRGVSRVLAYILSVAIATALVAGVLIATSNLVDDQTATATDTELRVAGDRLAAKMMQADQMAKDDPSASFVLDPDVPREAGGVQYSVEVVLDVTPDGRDRLVLKSEENGVVRNVTMRVDTKVAETETLSGDFIIVRKGGQIRLTREGSS